MTRQEAKDMLQPGVVLEFAKDTGKYIIGEYLEITHIGAFSPNSMHGIFHGHTSPLGPDHADPSTPGWSIAWFALALCEGTVRIKKELSIADRINKIVDGVLNDV